jgi:hypothetical protein
VSVTHNRSWHGQLAWLDAGLFEGLILGAGGDTVHGQDDQKPFQFMFTRQMLRQPLEEVEISPEPDAACALDRECKMFAPNNFRDPPHSFGRIRLASLIHEQPVVYQLLGLRLRHMRSFFQSDH